MYFSRLRAGSARHLLICGLLLFLSLSVAVTVAWAAAAKKPAPKQPTTAAPAKPTTAAPAKPAGPPTVKLASARQALLPIIISETASEQVKASAQTLADYLQQISGATFTVKIGDGTTGLAVGIHTDFPKVVTKAPFDGKEVKKREEYLLRSHGKGVYLLGATDLAVQNAVWDFLFRLGHRQFFPNPIWEVIPSNPAPTIAIDAWESPSYYARRIWYGFGTFPVNGKHYADWCAKNRALGSITLNTGHAYDGIINSHKAEFAAHPEYLALTKDAKTGEMKRGGAKFCIANADLRKLVVAYCLNQFAMNPALDSVSLDPSDGGGWCECDDCVTMGSVTDRVITLANEAAAAIDKEYPGKLVGVYAYYMHSPPPAIKVHPNVVVSAATAFSSYTIDQLLDGWSTKEATMGIREYYAVNVWTRDLPGAASGTNLDYLQRTIPHFHAKGARFMSSESGDCWGPNGLGYYFATRMLWNVNEAKYREAIVNDFLDKAFGPAKKPMAEFYRLIDGSKRQLMSDDLVGRMYRLLRAAKGMTTDAKIQARINALVLYTHYVDLFANYQSATGDARQQAFERLIRHAYRMHETGMVHTYALYRDLPGRDRSVTVPEGCAWNVPDAKNPWKQEPPVTEQVIQTMLTEGIEKNKLLDFTPVAFSTKLVPATKLGLPKAPNGQEGIATRFAMDLLTWVPEGVKEINFTYFGNGRVFSLESPKSAVIGAIDKIDLAQAEVVAKENPTRLTLKTTYTGLHTITVDGNRNGTAAMRMLDGLPMTIHAEAPIYYRWYLYFYVPKGTKVIGGYSEANQGSLLNPDGKEAFAFHKMPRPGYFSVPVPDGMDGKLWKMSYCAGRKILMTVPPYYACNAEELLLPAEVVEKDAPK